MLSTVGEKISAFKQYLAASKKRTFTFAITVLVLIALPLLVIVSQQQQTIRQRASELISPPGGGTAAASINIDPTEINQKIGEAFSVPVFLHAKENNITGVDITIVFDKKVLELVSFEKSPVLTNQLINTVDNQAGTFHYAATETSSPQNTGDIKLGTLNFKTNSKGVSNIAFQNVQITSLGNSLPLDTEAIPGKITIVTELTPISNTSTTSTTPIAGSSNRVFVTSTNYNGNLGGLSGADAKCQERANAARLGGTWKAWISAGNTSAASRLAHGNGQYQKLDGNPIANSWNDLTDGSIQNAIDITEFRTRLGLGTSVWTNTLVDGKTRFPQNTFTCNMWTSNSSQEYGAVGTTFSSDYRWTHNLYDTKCNESLPLFCFEQSSTLSIPTPLSTPTPTLTPPPTNSYQRVFLSSKSYEGNLGDVNGADTKCQELANAASLRGKWKAWISNDRESASSRLYHSTAPYKRLDGVTVANNWDDLIDGSLQNPINLTEKGNIRSNDVAARVWTNTGNNGEIDTKDINQNCYSWNNNSRSLNGTVGVIANTGWSSRGSRSCFDLNLLYCIEQSTVTPTPTRTPTPIPPTAIPVRPTATPTPTPLVPKITSILPLQAVPGTIIVIEGENFLTPSVPSSSLKVLLIHSDGGAATLASVSEGIGNPTWAQNSISFKIGNLPPQSGKINVLVGNVFVKSSQDFSILSTATPIPNLCTPCSADINKDGTVDTRDLSISGSCNNRPVSGTCLNADINKDGIIDLFDISCAGQQIGKRCIQSSPIAGKPLACGTYGDINGDKIISQADTQLVFDFIAKKTDFNDQQKLVADVDGNGKVDVLDSALLTRYTAGTSQTFPVCTTPTQIATTATPISIKGDFNKDRSVDILDYQIWRDEFLRRTQTKRSDANADGKINIIDFGIWRNTFNP